MKQTAQKEKRRAMPSNRAIYEHWAVHIDGLDLDRYTSLPDDYCCFACGSYHRIERAHIVALDQGGGNEVANLHLLCARCHIDSEYLPPDLYWSWLERMRQTSPTAHDINRYERIYGPDWPQVLLRILPASAAQ